MDSKELKAYVESAIPGYEDTLCNLRTYPASEQARRIEKLRTGRRQKPHGYAARLLNWLETNGHVEKEKNHANRRRH